MKLDIWASSLEAGIPSTIKETYLFQFFSVELQIHSCRTQIPHNRSVLANHDEAWLNLKKYNFRARYKKFLYHRQKLRFTFFWI